MFMLIALFNKYCVRKKQEFAKTLEVRSHILSIKAAKLTHDKQHNLLSIHSNQNLMISLPSCI